MTALKCGARRKPISAQDDNSQVRALDFLDALNLADALDATHFVDEAVEVAQVEGLDDEVDDGSAVGDGVGTGGADVGAVVGDDGGELLEQAGAVVAEHGEFDRVGPARLPPAEGKGAHSTWMRRSDS